MRSHIIKACFIILQMLVCLRVVMASDSTIIIFYGNDKGEINKRIFGNNLLGYDPGLVKSNRPHYFGNTDYGTGIWDPKLKKSVSEVIDLAKEAGITSMRFPGGCGAHHYDWKKAIGSNRENFLYGIDEFLKTCEEIGAEAVFTISYFIGNEQDAADLVEYLNSPNDGSNPGEGINWAAERAKNGHPLPYNVKYFEIGNEDWHGDHMKIKKISPEEYAERYLKYYTAMKAIDSSIQIGAILWTPEWNAKVMHLIKDKIDFGIMHTYPSAGVNNSQIERTSSVDLFYTTLASPILEYDPSFKNTRMLLKNNAGKNIPLAITEYNGNFKQEKPTPYRYCLGTALLNAELLRIFMTTENNILIANYWQFINSFWGMITNSFNGKYDTLYKHYFKRPSYFIYESYHKHFGDILLYAEVNCTTYSVNGHRIPYLSVNASKSKDGNKIYLMVINKNLDSPMSSTIELKDFVPVAEGNAWVLNGPSVDATNEKKHDNVKVTHRDFEITRAQGTSAQVEDQENSFSFEYTFEPHSVTAIELVRAQRTSSQGHK